MAVSKSRSHNLTALLGLALAYWITTSGHLTMDPWIDELYSLRNFILVPPLTTVSDYHVPNNHILFNLAENLWLRLTGVHDIGQLLSNPSTARWLPWMLGLGTVTAVYHFAKRRGGVSAGIVAGGLLISSMPFHNYATQLRGYGLSMFLFAMLIFVIDGAKQRPLAIMFLSAALIYTLPSNLMLLLVCSAGIVICMPCAVDGLSDRAEAARRAGLVLCGVVLAMVCYLPVWRPLMRLGQVSGSKASWSAVITTMPIVAWHFLSGRWLLLIPAALPLLRLRTCGRTFSRILLLTFICFVAPFLISALRGDGAPDRVFITVLPLVCGVWGIALNKGLARISTPVLRKLLVGVALAFCFAMLIVNDIKAANKAAADRLAGTRCADLFFQYYLWNFHPARTAVEYSSRVGSVPLVNDCRMDSELPKYLRLRGVRFYPADSLQPLLERYREIDVISDAGVDDTAYLRGLRKTVLSPELGAPWILRVERAPAE